LPPLAEEYKDRKTLILDLDETLVHSTFTVNPKTDFTISVHMLLTLRFVWRVRRVIYMYRRGQGWIIS